MRPCMEEGMWLECLPICYSVVEFSKKKIFILFYLCWFFILFFWFCLLSHSVTDSCPSSLAQTSANSFKCCCCSEVALKTTSSSSGNALCHFRPPNLTPVGKTKLPWANQVKVNLLCFQITVNLKGKKSQALQKTSMKIRWRPANHLTPSMPEI